jgi:hypothetical protein
VLYTLIYGISTNEKDIFLEVQSYDDSAIYWRLFMGISRYYDQSGSSQAFTAVILFIDKKYDPKNCPILDFVPTNSLIRL